jgi:phosphate transport system protein
VLSHHISSQFNEDLQDVHTKFMTMGGLVEQQVANAIHALLDTDENLAIDVQFKDNVVNQYERDIDEGLTLILARRHPAAIDLRMVIAMSKANTDLERIGDEASKIARIAQNLCEEGESPRGYMETRHIGNQVRVMIHDALDAFARLDVVPVWQGRLLSYLLIFNIYHLYLPISFLRHGLHTNSIPLNQTSSCEACESNGIGSTIYLAAT